MPENELECVIRGVLTGDERKNALEFAAHLRENGMEFEAAPNGYWRDKPYWHVKYCGEYVCFVFIHGSPAKYPGEPEGWIVWTDDSDSTWFSNFPLEDRVREIAWEKVDLCVNCTPNGPCAGGRRRTIFGRDFDHVCRTAMMFLNPDAEAVACLKKLVEIRRADILAKL